ncbi:MAG: hypothetical protein MR025_07610 [Helicobacter trogontum]|uniref:hypothetical protein n=1 Tax=Helicobacter trogontum TaxID=50960 RepID=UPI00242F382B|nr:hypothetical protein [Helicobacter trogontum]MCI5787295.1 hypothetical protein [Helicobacter trogontum]
MSIVVVMWESLWFFDALLSFGMPEKALAFLAVRLIIPSSSEIKINPETIARTMLQVDPKKVNNEQCIRYGYGEIIKKLQVLDIEPAIMSSIEWKFIQLENFYCKSLFRYMLKNLRDFLKLTLSNDSEIQNLSQEDKEAYGASWYKFLGIFSFLDLENGQLIFSIEELQGWIDEVLVILDTEIKSGKEESIFLRTIIGRLLERLIDGRDVALLPEDILKFIENNLKDDWITKGFIKELKYPWLPRVKTKEVDEGGEDERREAEKYENYAKLFNDKMYNNLFECFSAKTRSCKKEAELEDAKKKGRILL